MTVVSLRDLGRDDVALAGGKGANLGELVRAGFPVPDGFVVTTAASGDSPSSITEAYERLGGGPVAVRSSATAEDLPGATFAGQQETYLNVVGAQEVVAAVERCRASLWTERAVAYRARLGIRDDEVGIAVVVQVMVPAEFAGVLFTADPLTGARDRTVIDATAGLGEAVVSGTVTPDHYVVVRRHVRSRSGNLLPDKVIRELARLGRRVERHFGAPQDIEWAVVAGRISLVQARPMTALPPPPVKLSAMRRRLASILVEYLPVRPYPMDMSTWVPYGPAGLMAEVIGHFGLHGAFTDYLPEKDGVVTAFVPPSPRPTWAVLRAPWRIASLARRFDPAHWTDDPRFIDFLSGVRAAESVEIGKLDWSELLKMPHRALELVKPITGLRISYFPRTGLSFARLLLALKLMGKGRLFGDLLAGAHTRTTDANLELERLASLPPSEVDLAPFLAEYGHRETSTLILVSPPTWSDQPEMVTDLIRMLASQPPHTADVSGAAMRQISKHKFLVRWAKAAQAGVAFREDSHFHFTRPLPLLRRSLLEMGRRLGIGEDIFHLRLEEVEALPDPAAPQDPAICPANARILRARILRDLIRARKAKRAELDGVPLIDPALVFGAPPADGSALVAGTPASRGKATGPVRIVLAANEFSRLKAGDILVCPYTNPSWTPLFQRAAAVVVDTGGVGSHAAIVAREYGIPAIMGTACGTTVLTDGQMVVADGDTGRVVPA
ncbi:MAG TPA: PEP/pyruvate-binding domain-containing protein [Candidatus Limnocylindrales bacterium]|nr:PEP/pyruvate-binding domain-containing protein [Candidatus Limnocylindrales bacterium]